jgi:hypothetical protein
MTANNNNPKCIDSEPLDTDTVQTTPISEETRKKALEMMKKLLKEGEKK